MFPQVKSLVADNWYVLREPGKIATRKEEPLIVKIVCIAVKYTLVIHNLLTDKRKGDVDNKAAVFSLVFFFKRKIALVIDDKLCC